MICRIWHGWTTIGQADAYEQLLREEIFHGIAARGIVGFRGSQVLRRTAGEEVEFVTMMWFETLEAVREFAGSDYERAVVPPGAQRLLQRFDERAAHYDVRDDRREQGP